VSEHATVKVGDYTIPLIGVPKDASQQRCEGCKENFHLSEITLDTNGNPMCPGCLKKQEDRPVT